jgi:very-short-patch-repair endonuclease
MRQLSTPSERALWQLLRAGQLGVHFRRQVPLLGCCIVDFCALAARLVVEVDGGYHGSVTRQRADARRDRRLQKAGFRVLRLSAELVIHQPEKARELVLKELPKGAR